MAWFLAAVSSTGCSTSPKPNNISASCHKVILIGDRQPWLDALGRNLESGGLEVRINTPPDDGSLVLFCVSCADGPMPGTVKAVEMCDGCTIADYAFLLVGANPRWDPTLIELIELEMVNLVSHMMPGTTLDTIGPYEVIKITEPGTDTADKIRAIHRKDRPPTKFTTPAEGLLKAASKVKATK